MKEIIERFKNLFREKFNVIITLLLLIVGLNIYSLTCIHNDYIKIKKRIDFRYFNTTRSLEDIHNVEINTLNGELKPFRH